MLSVSYIAERGLPLLGDLHRRVRFPTGSFVTGMNLDEPCRREGDSPRISGLVAVLVWKLQIPNSPATPIGGSELGSSNSAAEHEIKSAGAA